MALSNAKVNLWNRAVTRTGSTKLIQSEDDGSPEADVCGLHYDDLVRALLESKPWRFARFQQPITQISSQTQEYTGDGAEANFTIPYPYLSTSQVSVTVDGVTQTAETDYSFADVAAGESKYITFTSAPDASAEIIITVTASRYGWKHCYALPSDFISAVGLLYGAQNNQNAARYELQANHQRLPHRIFPNDEKTGFILACHLDSNEFDQLEYIGWVDDVRLFPRVFCEALICLLAAELYEAVRKEPRNAEAKRKEARDIVSAAFVNDLNNSGADYRPVTPGVAVRGGSANLLGGEDFYGR